MTQERAKEIMQKVIYANLRFLPSMICVEDAVRMDWIIGKIQLCLDMELEKEIEHKEGET